MGTNVSLTAVLERFTQSCVESGRYNNVSEVVRSALRLLQEREEARTAFVKSLEQATAEGEHDGFRTGQQIEASVMAVIAEVRERGR
jgi:antitoxin ParD1/3/4